MVFSFARLPLVSRTPLLAVLLAVLLAGCVLWPTRSEYLRKLVSATSGDQIGRPVKLFARLNWDHMVSAEVEIEKLISDGFFLDVGDDPDRVYVRCGRYRLPLEESFTLNSHGFRMPPSQYHISMSVNDGCLVERIEGSKIIAKFRLP